jgi:hypothetical protein
MNETVILTKKEIAEAIVRWIGIFKKQSAFFPYRISDTDEPLHIPDSVLFRLEYIPKGSKTVEHNI